MPDRSLGIGMSEIEFIGDELKTFAGRLIRRGVLTRRDLNDLIEDVKKRTKRLELISQALEKHL